MTVSSLGNTHLYCRFSSQTSHRSWMNNSWELLEGDTVEREVSNAYKARVRDCVAVHVHSPGTKASLGSGGFGWIKWELVDLVAQLMPVLLIPSGALQDGQDLCAARAGQVRGELREHPAGGGVVQGVCAAGAGE